MAIFAREKSSVGTWSIHILERLGELKDLVFDTPTGTVVALRVRIERDLEPSKLPWEVVDGLVQIPADDISRIASRIHLKR